MNKRLITLLLAAGIAVIFIATGLHAGTDVKDTITMNSKVYKKHKQGPDAKKPKKLVEFTHAKHAGEYKISCADCHHDKDGKPLTGLKAGGEVQKCDACHDRTKAVKKDKTYQGVNKKKPIDIMHHQSAIHENCIGCHKTAKIKKGKKCKDCHIPM